MTGFGEAQLEAGSARIHVQIRTVNHRHFHVHFRIPTAIERWEPDITRVLRERLSRGSVHYRLEVLPKPGEMSIVRLDEDRIRAYITTLRAVQREHDLAGDVTLDLIMRLPDILKTETGITEPLGFEREHLLAVTRSALDPVVNAREREGDVLSRDLTEALDVVDAALTDVEGRAPERLERERDRLRSAVRELTEGREVDEDRLAREIAYLAERWDINEEIVRLRSHVDEFRALLAREDSEPVGKRLGFWVQEMHREANTIGSKANDSAIARYVVQIKTAIEKLREQVDNVE